MKATNVIGRQVTSRDGGRQVGRIKDLVVDPAGREVIGLVLSDSMFLPSKVAAWKAVQAFGEDNVVLDTMRSVVKAGSDRAIKAALAKKTHIKGLRLVTTKGKDLGKISDVVFDETTGEIYGYELSGGRFSDVFDGTPFLPTPQWIELGKDVAFIAPEIEATVVPSGRQKPGI